MTEREKLTSFMRKQGFSVLSFEGQPFQGSMNIISSCSKTIDGHTHLIDGLCFVMWGGSNTEFGDLGCVTFHYSGKTRLKYHKSGYQSEMLKKSFCPKSAKEAKEAFKVWIKETQEIRKSWKLLV